LCWEALRDKALSRLESEAALGLVDEELMHFLKLLNKTEDVFTTSSCSGRIVVACNDVSPCDKKGTKMLLKSHSTISVNDLIRAIEKAECKHIWAKSSHPLLDVAVKDLQKALDIVDHAKRAGFKYSGVQRSHCCYRVIIRSNDSLYFPLFKDEDAKRLARVVSELNKFLLEGKVRLARLMSSLEAGGLLSMEAALEDLLL